MAADATPKVEVLANSVSDKAGNTNTLLLTVAAARDGIAPTLAVTLTGDTGASGVPLGNSSVTATITTNETLPGSPTFKVAMVAKATESATPDHYDLDATGTLTAIKFATSYVPAAGVAAGNNAKDNAMGQPNTGVIFIATNTWEKTLTAPEFLPAGGGSLYVITIQGNDVSGNTGKKGTSDPTSTSAILFELDKSLPTPTITPANGSQPDGTDPFFITVNWTAEGNEYDGDSHTGVALTVATLDSGDVLGQASTQDNRTFTITMEGGLALGEHTLARIHRCGAALGLEQGVRAVGRDGPRSIPINGAGGGLWLELVAPMAVLGSGVGAGSAGQHAREDNRGPGRCDSVGWLSSLVDVSGAVGAVRQAMAGLAIEPGRE